jgi:hypothetical protein
MDIASVAGMSTAMTQQQTNAQASILVLKKAMEIESSNALQLLQALPQAASNPPNLGNNIDIRA